MNEKWGGEKKNKGEGPERGKKMKGKKSLFNSEENIFFEIYLQIYLIFEIFDILENVFNISIKNIFRGQ